MAKNNYFTRKSLDKWHSFQDKDTHTHTHLFWAKKTDGLGEKQTRTCTSNTRAKTLCLSRGGKSFNLRWLAAAYNAGLWRQSMKCNDWPRLALWRCQPPWPQSPIVMEEKLPDWMVQHTAWRATRHTLKSFYPFMSVFCPALVTGGCCALPKVIVATDFAL